MVRVRLFILFTLLSLSVNAQDSLNGKWYMFSRNRMVQFDILTDIIITKQLNWDLSDRFRSKPDTSTIMVRSSANRNTYLWTNNAKRDVSKINLITIKVVRPDKEIFIAVNGPDEPFDDSAAVSEYIKNDTAKKFGMPLFSNSEMSLWRNQKNITTMSETDFKSFADRGFQVNAQLDSLSELTNAPNGLLYYGYAMTRILIAQLGYNPFYTNREFDELILRFKNNPKTKALVAKIFGESK